jgi:DNA mismatch repair protein MutL
VFEGGVLHSKQPVAAPPGTTIEVENLFFNTPARRKFLKSEATEARHISRVATAMAIGSYSVGFSYWLNGREVFVLPREQDPAMRVAELLTPGKKLLKIEGTEGPVKVEGYIGLPDMVQSNRYGQFLFINGRSIQSASFSHAFMSGYGELMPRGSFPVGALLLTVDPSEVDVNVHPGKTEVRLSHEREIYSAIYHLVKDTVRQDTIIPSFRPGGQPARQGENRTESSSGNGRDQSHVIPGIGNRPSPTPDFLRKLYDPPNAPGPEPTGGIVRVDTSTGEIVHESRSEEAHSAAHARVDDAVRTLPGQDVSDDVLSGLRLVGRFSDLYLLFQAGETLLIVDQHTAHERVLYERTLKQIETQQMVGQQMLLPVQLELTPEQFALFDEVAELLNGSGFVISHFGGRMLNVEAVPAVLTRKAPEKVVMKVLDDLASMKKAGFDLKKAMAQTIACRAAVMSGDRLSPEEAEGLVRELLKCENRYSCPHGRPTFIKITRDDLDRQFGRG